MLKRVVVLTQPNRVKTRINCMNEKMCCTCKEIKPLTEFNKNVKRKDGVGTKCRDCMKVYLKTHYHKNPNYYRNKALRGKKDLAVFVNELKSKTPCKDCGQYFDPVCMDFDHLEGFDKLGNISRFTNSGCTQKVLQEITKCELVCACCHRLRTKKRMAEAQ